MVKRFSEIKSKGDEPIVDVNQTFFDGETDSVANKKHGMGVLVTILLIAGENAGCGILALPYAFDQAGWYSLPLLIMCCLDAGICGILIGKCWMILEERWPEFRENCRYPYPAIGKMAWSIAVTLILVDVTSDYVKLENHPPTSPPTIEAISLAFGTFIFSFGGTAAFPTFQNDMRDKSKFTRSVVIGFSTLLALYIPIAIMGFITYGLGVKNNIILSIPNGVKKDTAILLLSGHLFFAFIIVINGAVQEIEGKFKVPNSFGWKRVIVRTACMTFVMFIGETIPRFGKILDLMGGSAVTMLAYILPPLFYMKLCSMHNESWPERKVTILEKIYYYKIIIVGVVGGISCTFWALKAILAPGAFSLPCYIDIHCSNE
ncbi:LOW QUALITY PROTEIN: proton-coupled amino acid transporter 1-like [Panonychus citri]|uniref:LOW QUALITY PROTEIN: proton-coupled amino acid transporter 1-like n=1 Tax=Panonychus citri TaxID=50023 RepID=UPI002308099E|nr:LOW QUALITY PROTEIN: proton-coupled amino acid transporter 1-like [Panonychus citri]